MVCANPILVYVELDSPALSLSRWGTGGDGNHRRRGAKQLRAGLFGFFLSVTGPIVGSCIWVGAKTILLGKNPVEGHARAVTSVSSSRCVWPLIV